LLAIHGDTVRVSRLHPVAEEGLSRDQASPIQLTSSKQVVRAEWQQLTSTFLVHGQVRCNSAATLNCAFARWVPSLTIAVVQL